MRKIQLNSRLKTCKYKTNFQMCLVLPPYCTILDPVQLPFFDGKQLTSKGSIAYLQRFRCYPTKRSQRRRGTAQLLSHRRRPSHRHHRFNATSPSFSLSSSEDICLPGIFLTKKKPNRAHRTQCVQPIIRSWPQLNHF